MLTSLKSKVVFLGIIGSTLYGIRGNSSLIISILKLYSSFV